MHTKIVAELLWCYLEKWAFDRHAVAFFI